MATSGTIAVDEATPFFTFDGLRRAGNAYTFINSIDVTAGCRMIKSEQELALMQTAKNITLEPTRPPRASCVKALPRPKCRPSSPPRTASSARKAITVHAVLFGEATAYPHGVPYPQTLKLGV